MQETKRRGSDLKECDLVMKGGITSGVVYPQAVLVLSGKYRFRSIGGGSVGGVAAALTAAAELGSDGAGGGFELLEAEQRKLEEEGFLMDVFRAPKSTRPLMDALLDLTERKKKGWASVVLGLLIVLPRRCPGAFFLGALLGAALLVVIERLVSGSWGGWYVAALLVALLAGVGCALGRLLWILLKTLPERNLFGLCAGHGDPEPGRHPLLTDWLDDLFKRLAGKGGADPLTFRDLAERTVVIDGEEKAAGISLRTLTTNLNHNEPYVFPRKFDTFLFKSREMGKLFPREVVRYMERMGAEVTPAGVKLPTGLHFLPHENDLPIIVPVRMGISFPILLSAVPLYTVKPSSWQRLRGGSLELGEEDLQKNWFSDGGICSNFPIHFFDTWLSRRPTFGINLTSPPEKGAPSAPSVDNLSAPAAAEPYDARLVDRSGDAYLPKPDTEDYPQWTGFESLAGFGWAILGSAMNYRDAMQSRLPSYQERIVQIPLGSDEGGLNLNMPPAVIEEMVKRGKEAGTKLSEEFVFDHHRWVRLRVLMNEIETNLKGIGQELDPATVGQLFEDQLDQRFPYHEDDPAWCVEAQRRVGQLAALVEDWNEQDGGRMFFEPVSGAEPEPELRVTPNV